MIILALLLPAGQAFAANTEKEITVNFVPMHFIIDGVEYAPPADQPGFLYITSDNKTHTYVPLRFVANILYKSVGWDGNAVKVTVGEPDPTIEADLAKQAVEQSVIEPVDKSKLQRTAITVNQANITYEFNGLTVEPSEETPGFIYKSRVYVPLRFMYNSLGYDNDHIKFDGSTYTIEAVSTDEQLAYKRILKDYAAELQAIFEPVQSELTGIYLTNIRLVNSGKLTEDDKAALFEEVDTLIREGKDTLMKKLDELSQELTAGEHGTNAVDHYLSYYENLEAQARNLLNNQLKPSE